MDELAIDIETYSDRDISKTGVYKYIESPAFEIILFAYSLNGAPVEILDLTQEALPIEIIKLLSDHRCLKTAHNANFERLCLSEYLLTPLPVEQWQCTMIKAAMLGWPMSLDAVTKAMNLTEKKDAEGKALIKYFCTPCKPTASNGMRTRNLPHHNPEKWERFKQYCVQDVVAERAISTHTQGYQIPVKEKRLYCLDQKINDRGVLLDISIAKNAIKINTDYVALLEQEAITLTGLDNPNSAAQLKEWLSSEMPLDIVDTLRKGDIPDLIKNSKGYTNHAVITRVLKIRQEMSKTSVKKYQAMVNCFCGDNRVRGLLQFLGANRTWRWAGRLVQLQNLPQNHLSDLWRARQIVKDNDGDLLQLIYGNVPNTLSELIRTAFIAPPGKTLGIADFSAIEARVISWLANEEWRLEVFRSHGKIYEAAAAQMFGVPIESVTKGSDYRQRGKISELALGYQGGENALITMGALKMGIAEDELPKIKNLWRSANPKIVRLWYKVQDAAISAVQGGPVNFTHGIRFYTSANKDTLFIKLPSGRSLAYVSPKLVQGKFGPALTYMGMDQTTKQWKRQDTYGGKLVENIVQAISRDLLAEAMLEVDAAGYPIVLHVHDEIAAELNLDTAEADLKKITEIMSREIIWAKGLPMAADSYLSEYYKKD